MSLPFHSPPLIYCSHIISKFVVSFSLFLVSHFLLDFLRTAVFLLSCNFFLVLTQFKLFFIFSFLPFSFFFLLLDILDSHYHSLPFLAFYIFLCPPSSLQSFTYILICFILFQFHIFVILCLLSLFSSFLSPSTSYFLSFRICFLFLPLSVSIALSPFSPLL